MAKAKSSPANAGSDPTTDPAPAAASTRSPSSGMTAAEAADLVVRSVPKLGEDGKPTGESEDLPVGADEVFAFRDHGDHVVVVTVDGQKLTGSR